MNIVLIGSSLIFAYFKFQVGALKNIKTMYVRIEEVKKHNGIILQSTLMLKRKNIPNDIISLILSWLPIQIKAIGFYCNNQYCGTSWCQSTLAFCNSCQHYQCLCSFKITKAGISDVCVGCSGISIENCGGIDTITHQNLHEFSVSQYNMTTAKTILSLLQKKKLSLVHALPLSYRDIRICSPVKIDLQQIRK